MIGYKDFLKRVRGRVEIFAENTTRCLDDGDKDIMGKGDSRIHR